jgi:RNA polymerase sigma factor (TIGR02999 family)
MIQGLGDIMTLHDSAPPGAPAGWDELPTLLAAAESDQGARDRAMALLYPELKRIAEAQMRRERPDHTLQATGLVSEFFMYLARSTSFNAHSRAHFLVLASIVMRRLLVDYARARKRDKRGGQLVRVDMEHVEPGEPAHFADLLEIDELLTKLAGDDPRMARVVELRFFGGLTNAETGEALGVTERTVKRDWQIARAWLYTQLRRDNVHGLRGLGPS